MIVVDAKTAAHGDPPKVWAPGHAQEPSAVGMRLVEAANAAENGVPKWSEVSVVEHGMQGLRDRHVEILADEVDTEADHVRVARRLATTLCKWTEQKVTLGRDGTAAVVVAVWSDRFRTWPLASCSMIAWKGTQRASTMRVGRERLLKG